MAMLGWCLDGFHVGGTYKWGTVCPGEASSKCNCWCHTGKCPVHEKLMPKSNKAGCVCLKIWERKQ